MNPVVWGTLGWPAPWWLWDRYSSCENWGATTESRGVTSVCSSCRAEDLVWIAVEKQSLPGPSALVPSDVQSDGRDGLVAELWSETVRSRA